MQCNINNTDRINRGIIGAFIAITACLNFSKTFYVALGMILVLQAAIGWCSIPYLLRLSTKKAQAKTHKKN